MSWPRVDYRDILFDSLKIVYLKVEVGSESTWIQIPEVSLMILKNFEGPLRFKPYSRWLNVFSSVVNNFYNGTSPSQIFSTVSVIVNLNLQG